MKQIFLVCALSIVGVLAFGQGGPILHIGFDACDGSDQIGNLDDEFTNPSIDCDCGVELEASYFDEEADSLYLDPNVKDLFNQDFTFSMYFWAEDAPEPYSIFSIQRNCSKDSSFVIRYLPQIQEVDVEISKNFGVGSFMTAPVNKERCWHHLVFTKEGTDYSLTVDGVFIETNSILEPVTMGERHRVRVGASPCLNDTETFMRGRVDQIFMYDYPLDLEAITSLNEKPDQIITLDTTIFAGNSVFIETGGVCTPSFSWAPNSGLDNPSLLEPTSTPDNSITYFLNIDHGSCQTSDSIKIFVIEDEDIDCNELLLPNVFTPNGDKVNDEFEISNPFIISEMDYFEIYDRWGTKMFETTNKAETWDGTFNGLIQAPSMYVYKIEYTCRDEKYKKLGSFSLLK